MLLEMNELPMFQNILHITSWYSLLDEWINELKKNITFTELLMSIVIVLIIYNVMMSLQLIIIKYPKRNRNLKRLLSWWKEEIEICKVQS